MTARRPPRPGSICTNARWGPPVTPTRGPPPCTAVTPPTPSSPSSPAAERSAQGERQRRPGARRLVTRSDLDPSMPAPLPDRRGANVTARCCGRWLRATDIRNPGWTRWRTRLLRWVYHHLGDTPTPSSSAAPRCGGPDTAPTPVCRCTRPSNSQPATNAVTGATALIGITFPAIPTHRHEPLRCHPCCATSPCHPCPDSMYVSSVP
jgi:hypothetical protein